MCQPNQRLADPAANPLHFNSLSSKIEDAVQIKIQTGVHVSSTVTINGVSIAYRFDGPENGRVVLLSNSLMSNYDMWDLTVPALSDRYRVLRYDTRGHGRSGVTPGPYSIDMLADDVSALLKALNIKAAHIAGLSMGGMIAQQMGARYPDQVLSLGLCDTASEMPPRQTWAERLAIAEKEGIPGLADGTIKRWFTAGFVERAPKEIEKVRKFILGTPVTGYIGCASAVRDMAQTTMLLKIKSPTLIMTGRYDPACTVDQSTVLHRIIEGSEMVVIEDAAHLSNIEQPQFFNQTLRNFLDRVDDQL
ncbi:MAG: 3-oxoadipate enol-lactonase [Limnohabitans sp.]|nr:3-oxoadipate enol-lactonase [Limnohabitans sp.]